MLPQSDAGSCPPVPLTDTFIYTFIYLHLYFGQRPLSSLLLQYYIYLSLQLLVTACPCALILSTPVTVCR